MKKGVKYDDVMRQVAAVLEKHGATNEESLTILSTMAVELNIAALRKMDRM